MPWKEVTAVNERMEFVARLKAGEPCIGRALGNAGGLRGIGHAPPLFADAAHQKGSTMDRHAGILVNVHPGLRLKGWLDSQPQPRSPVPDEQPS